MANLPESMLPAENSVEVETNVVTEKNTSPLIFDSLFDSSTESSILPIDKHSEVVLDITDFSIPVEVDDTEKTVLESVTEPVLPATDAIEVAASMDKKVTSNVAGSDSSGSDKNNSDALVTRRVSSKKDKPKKDYRRSIQTFLNRDDHKPVSRLIDRWNK